MIRRKYRNIKADGYDSKREARRAAELRLLQRAGEISDLREQVTFELIPKQGDMRATKYIADFVYVDKNGNQHVEDSKGFRTAEYRIKRKLMRFVHGITVEEV